MFTDRAVTLIISNYKNDIGFFSKGESMKSMGDQERYSQ